MFSRRIAARAKATTQPARPQLARMENGGSIRSRYLDCGQVMPQQHAVNSSSARPSALVPRKPRCCASSGWTVSCSTPSCPIEPMPEALRAWSTGVAWSRRMKPEVAPLLSGRPGSSPSGGAGLADVDTNLVGRCRRVGLESEMEARGRDVLRHHRPHHVNRMGLGGRSIVRTASNRDNVELHRSVACLCGVHGICKRAVILGFRRAEIDNSEWSSRVNTQRGGRLRLSCRFSFRCRRERGLVDQLAAAERHVNQPQLRKPWPHPLPRLRQSRPFRSSSHQLRPCCPRTRGS